mgnify:FL=1
MYKNKEQFIIFLKKYLLKYVKILYFAEITNRELLKNISIGVIWEILILKTKEFFENERLLSMSEFFQEYNYIIDNLEKYIEEKCVNLNNKEIIYQARKIVKDNAIYQEKNNEMIFDIDSKKIREKLNDKFHISKKCFLAQNYDLRIEKVFRKIGAKFFYELEQDFL